MTDFKKLAGQSISSLVPYKPGKPVKELEREMGISNIVKLASNENPCGTSPKAAAAVKAFVTEANRYPLGDCYYLTQKLSAKLGVPSENLVFGSGSNEIIELMFRAFLKEGDVVMSYAPSFSVYGIIAQAMGSSCTWIPVNEDFSVNFPKLKEALNKNVRIVFLANPNNPTGGYFTKQELVDFMAVVPEDTLVVMDEAYYEFVDAEDYPQTIEMLAQYPNMIIMRTFSKAYGLAAFRIGYAIAHKDCIDILHRVRQPFNVNMLAQVAAEAALEDHDFLNLSLATNKIGKEYLYAEFEGMGLRYVPTQANFILVHVKDGEVVFNELLKRGVIARYLGPGLKEWIRVSVGTKEENEIFIRELKAVLAVMA